MRHFAKQLRANCTDPERMLCRNQRSRWAIEARLAKLGKIPEPPAGLRFPIRPPAAAQPRAAYSPR